MLSVIVEPHATDGLFTPKILEVSIVEVSGNIAFHQAGFEAAPPGRNYTPFSVAQRCYAVLLVQIERCC